MSIKKQLQDVYEQIMSAKYPDDKKEIQNLLQHKLLPLIEDNAVLNEEYERRICYHERLTTDASYLDLIKRIHKEIVALQKLIDPSKLPDSPRLFKPKHDDLENNEPWIAMKDLHSILNKEDTWWELGEVTTFQVDDHVRTPWRPVVRQYQIVMGLLEYAYKAKAIDIKKADEHITTLQKHLGDLERRLERPFIRLHIHDFDFLNHYMRDPQWISDDERSYEQVKKYVDRVYKDLLLFLEDREEYDSTHMQLNFWMKNGAKKMAELQKAYERLAKKIDVAGIVELHENNPAIVQAIESVTKPEFLEHVGRTQQLEEKIKEKFGKQLIEMNKQLDASGMKKMQEAMTEVVMQFERIKPDLEVIEQQRAIAAETFSAIGAQVQSVLPSMVEYGKMMSEQNELIQSAGRSLIAGGDRGAASFLSVSPSVPTLPPDAVIIPREEYLEYERLKARYRTDQARAEESQEVQEWQGDQDVEYNYNDRLLTVGDTTVEVPRSERSVNRQVLLQLLADDFLAEEDGMGVTSALFTGKLDGLGMPTNMRTLQTAVDGVNGEVKESLGLAKFVRLRAGTARIHKKR